MLFRSSIGKPEAKADRDSELDSMIEKCRPLADFGNAGWAGARATSESVQMDGTPCSFEDKRQVDLVLRGLRLAGCWDLGVPPTYLRFAKTRQDATRPRCTTSRFHWNAGFVGVVEPCNKSRPSPWRSPPFLATYYKYIPLICSLSVTIIKSLIPHY